MNRARPLCPGTLIATRSPRTLLRERNCFSASRNQLDRIGFRLAEDFWILDEIERIGDDPARLVVRHAAQRLDRALANIDTPNSIALGHANSSL